MAEDPSCPFAQGDGSAVGFLIRERFVQVPFPAFTLMVFGSAGIGAVLGERRVGAVVAAAKRKFASSSGEHGKK